MLVRSETSDMARYALENIPGDEAEGALLSALETVGGEMKIGVISSLGARASAAAVPALSRIASDTESGPAAHAAVEALGTIGGTGAEAVLLDILENGAETLKTAAAAGLLNCADRLMGEERPIEASSIFETVFSAGISPSIRRAAFRGKVAAAGKDAPGLILDALASRDSELQIGAAALVPSVFDASSIGSVLPYLEKLPEAGRIILVSALADFPNPEVLAAVRRVTGDTSVDVRIAALRTLESVGDASTVAFLAGRAAVTRGAEQAAARESLWRIRGEGAEEAVLSLLEQTRDDKVLGELIQAAGERRIIGVKDSLMRHAATASPSVRLQAARALRTLASPADMDDLLDLMLFNDDPLAREELLATISAVTQIMPRPAMRSAPVRLLLEKEEDGVRRGLLLKLLARIGDDASLPVVRKALVDPDPAAAEAAARTLIDWPTVTARDDVLEIARTSPGLTLRVLAMRAFVRLVGLERHRAPRGSVADLTKALTLCERPEEKMLILGALPAFASPEALVLAASLLGDDSVGAEALAAVDRIRDRLKSP